MTLKNRVVRWVAALAAAGVVSAQIPVSGGTAMAQDDCFTNEIDDNSGNFLGIRGLSNKDVISGVTFGLVGYALVTTISDSKGGGAAAASGGGSSAGGAGAGGGAQAPIAAPGDKEKPIYDVTAANSGDFSTLKSLLDEAMLDKTLREEGPFTFFAPTNGAFTGGFGAAVLAGLKADKTLLANFLRKHIVVGRYTISDLKALPDGKPLLTLSGDTVTITKDGGLKINGVAIVENDIAASNGWIHPISGVIP